MEEEHLEKLLIVKPCLLLIKGTVKINFRNLYEYYHVFTRQKKLSPFRETRYPVHETGYPIQETAYPTRETRYPFRKNNLTVPLKLFLIMIERELLIVL